jgi:molybdate/tungstate transport system substrate-binding protein
MIKMTQQLTLYVLVLGMLLLNGAAAAQTTCAPGSQQLIIYHAGSLTAAFSSVEKLFTQQTGICVVDVAAGSVDAARRVTAGQERCDIYASADFEDIDVLLKPAGYADYNILFAQGGMVLAYTTNSKNAATIAAPNGTFNPPTSVPDAAADWYAQLTQAGVTIGGSHPFLDPSGYRSDMIFQLTEDHYGVANLYDSLLTHYSINKSTDKLGVTYDYQFTYEHSALSAFKADTTNSYRYVKLPDAVSLSDPDENRRYREASVIIPGLHLPYSAPAVRIPGTRVVWGLTVLKTASNKDNAIKFLQLLFSSQGVALQKATGPAPISPPLVSHHDFRQLPASLRSLVNVERRDH